MVLLAVGYPGQAALVGNFNGSSQEPIFADSNTMTAYSAFGANKDDLFIINHEGAIAHTVDLGTAPLNYPSNESMVDNWVRDLF